MVPGNLSLLNIKRLVLAAGLYPLSLASRCFPRSKTIWVFGNQHGFRDNPRYMIEYVAQNCPAIRAVWLAHTEEILHEVQAAGLEAVQTSSFAGRWISLCAGVGVIGNGFGDLARGLIGGMFITQLWHGPPIKKILLDFPANCQITSGQTGWGRLLNAVVRFTSKKAWQGNTLIIATSDLVAERLSSAFGVPRSRVVVAGTPRSDILLAQGSQAVAADELLRETLFPEMEKSCKVVLYAPTWRENGQEDCLWESFDIETLNQRFKSLNAVLVIKLHPYCQPGPTQEIDDRGLHNVRTLRTGTDINRLMRICDVVVTDYSSLIADFSLLRRPIVYYTPDYQQYKDNRDFYEPLENLTLGKQLDRWSEVLEEVTRCLAGEAEAMEVSENLCQRFNQFEDTSNRERIVAEIKKRVGLE